MDHLSAVEAVAVLARRKGGAVADRVRSDPEAPIVLACDSLLDFDGESWGKAASAAEVVARWTRLAGGRGRLHTGHFATDTATGRSVSHTDSTVVNFGHPTPAQIAAYAATDESRRVAGPFTLEGRSAPWIESIEGNPGTVAGISLPVVARLLAALGVEVTQLWR